MTGRVLLEWCCGSVDDALQAEAGGADRIELCSALFLGGLTPSAGALALAGQRLKLPFVAMIRPRAGGFCPTATEFATMERDVDAALAAGAAGVVFGVLLPDGSIDVPRTRALATRAAGHDVVFHRAFDVTPDPERALDQLVDLGITRVLTSGQQPASSAGASLIARLIARAAGRITVMPGGGIRRDHVADIVSATGCREIHLAGAQRVADSSVDARPAIRFAGATPPPENAYDLSDHSLVAEVAGILRGHTAR